MKQVKDYRQFRKILRKYWKRHSIMLRRKGKTLYRPISWPPYVAVTLCKEDIEKHYTSIVKRYKNIEDVLIKFLDLVGKKVRTTHADRIGILTNLQITNEDFYYVIESAEGSLYISAVAGITPVS